MPETCARQLRRTTAISDRAEERRDLGRASRLHGEERDQDNDGERHDIGIERRRYDLQTFDRRKHGQRRRDDRVAVEQRAADNTEQDDRAASPRAELRCAAPSTPACRPRRCCPRAADQDVFCRHNQQQRPDDQRQNAEDDGLTRYVAGTGRCAMIGLAQWRKADWCRYRRRQHRCCRW